MPDEADGANAGPFVPPVSIKLPEIEAASRSVALLNTQLQGLKSTLGQFSSMTGNSLNRLLKEIKDNATAASTAVASVSGTVSGTGGASAAAGGASSASGWAQQAGAQAAAAVSSRLPGGIAAAGEYLKGTDSLAGGMAMGGLRFLRDRIATSRNLSIQTGGELGMVARQQGTRVEDIMKQMSQFPGNVMGTPRDLLDLFSAAPQLGASFGFGEGGRGAGRQGVRARGLFEGVREAQLLNPGESVGSIVGNIGGFAANTGAQQRSAFLTGGAYSMIAAGGRQKSLSEWAESILKWLQDLRGGSNRGKPFNYGELMAQYFPGSNIDAWFDANGVPQNMRQYWWTYALEKANQGNKGDFKIGADETNVAYQRLRATTELTRTEFNLGGQMMGAYVNKEQANRWFNQLFGQMQTNLIPAFANSIGKFVEYLPDTLEDLLMSGIEGIAAGDVSGDTAWGGGGGDIGDDGGWGEFGGTGLAGLSPNMRSKLGPMMRANPRLRINSGLRDNAMQKRLKDKGHSRVSGKPSAHTRGDAADLGPRSQYGWISKNAAKFGLKSGKNQGEPWHVGVGDVGDDAWDMFKDVFGALDDGASGVVSIVKWLFSHMFSIIPGLGNIGGGTPTRPETDTTGRAFLDKLVGAGGITIGGKLEGLPGGRVSTGAGAFTPDGGGVTPGGQVYGPGQGPGSNLPYDTSRADSTYSSFFRQVLQGLGVPVSQANLTKMGALAKYEGGGGTFNPFNSIGGDFPNKFNSVGVENYPNWDTGVQYTVKLLNQANTAQMRANLAQGGSYAAWRDAVTGFYRSWEGPPMPNISETNANAFLGRTPPGAVGDYSEMEYMASTPASVTQRDRVIQFHNTFNIGNTGNPGQGGMDVRRTVVLVADRLEDEMNRRLSRTN